MTLGSLAVTSYRKAQPHLSRAKKATIALALVLIIVGSLMVQSLFPLVSGAQYELSPEMYNLIGSSREDTSEYLKLSQDASAYEFEAADPAETGKNEHTGRVVDAYSARFGVAAKDGVSVTDTASKITATLIPDFYARDAQKIEGDHIVYLNGRNKLVYTLQYNGVKEDIIVPEYTSDRMSFTFKLQLPSGVEAQLDEQGNIGIFSADPTLFGNISYGSDDDREMIEKARESGEKTHLLMTIPFPIIKDASGTEHTDKAKFTLDEKQTIKRKDNGPEQAQLPADIPRSLISVNQYDLTIAAEQLKDLPYPLSIDPTMVVTAAGDFKNLNNEGGIEVDSTNNLIRRSSLTGGETEAWNTTADWLPTGRRQGCAWAYNGYLYHANGIHLVGGVPTSINAVLRAPIDPTTGNTTGNWTATSVSHAVGGACKATTYGGYAYTYSGFNNNLYMGKMDPLTGDIPSWTLTTSGVMASSRGPKLVTANNYIYAVGGNNGGTTYQEVRYAPVNADGTIGSWSATSLLLHGVTGHGAFYYNGWIYAVGGWDSSGGSNGRQIQRAKVQANGSLSTWVKQDNMLSLGLVDHATYVYGGYVYVAGGDSLAGLNDVQFTTHFAPVHADGSIGAFKLTANMGTIYEGAYTEYNGVLYSLGGCVDRDPNCVTSGIPGTYVNAVRFTKIRPAGETGLWTTQSNALTRGRSRASATVYNGFIYVAGGCTNCYNFISANLAQNVEYAPINADGSVGGWTGSANWGNTARAGVKAQAYNGYLYIVGGHNITTSGIYNTVIYAPINSDGSLGLWGNTTQNIGTARMDHGLAIYDGIMYVVGGSSTTTNTLSSTVYAPIDPDGNITTAFTADSDLLPGGGRTRMDVEVWGGKIYIVGGCTSLNGSSQCNTPIDTVSYADLSSSGISAWTDNLVGIGKNSYDYGNLVVIKGYLYIVGGQPVPYFNGAKFAKINSDGTVGVWTDSVSSLTFRTDPTSASDGNSLFFISGNDTRDVSYTTINNGGAGRASGSFVNTDAWSTGRYDFSTVVHNGYVYVTGGRTVNALNTRVVSLAIERGTIDAETGNITSWTNMTNMPDTGRWYHQAVVANDYMYIIGGRRGTGGSDNADIWRTSIDSAGNLGGWTDIGDYPHPVSEHQAVVVDDVIYSVGGFSNAGPTAYDTAYTVTIDASGNLGAWTPASSLPGGRRMHQMVVAADMLIVTGGMWNTGFGVTSDMYADVLVADITGPGTISSWRHAGILPNGKRIQHVSAASNGFLYFGQGCTTQGDVGGCSTNAINDMWVASIGANGTIGSWRQLGAVPDLGRVSSNGLAVNGKLTVVAGCISGCNANNEASNRARFVGLGSIPRIGQFNKKYDFDAGVKPTKLITRGTKQTGAKVDVNYASNVACNNTVFSNGGLSADIGYFGDNALDIALGSNRTLARCLFLRYTIDDTFSAVFPDASNETNITDFDLYYIANPGKRLRGGRTFTNGLDRGLNVQP